MSRHAGAVPGESQSLLRGGLYIDLLRGDVQRCGHIFCHLLSIRANLRGLRQQYCIDIHHGIAFFRQQTPHLRQQLQAGNPGIGRVRIREELSDVPQPGRAVRASITA